MNALDDEVTDELLKVLVEHQGDPSVAGFVIVGYGTRAFCAGHALRSSGPAPIREQGFRCWRVPSPGGEAPPPGIEPFRPPFRHGGWRSANRHREDRSRIRTARPQEPHHGTNTNPSSAAAPGGLAGSPDGGVGDRPGDFRGAPLAADSRHPRFLERAYSGGAGAVGSGAGVVAQRLSARLDRSCSPSPGNVGPRQTVAGRAGAAAAARGGVAPEYRAAAPRGDGYFWAGHRGGHRGPRAARRRDGDAVRVEEWLVLGPVPGTPGGEALRPGAEPEPAQRPLRQLLPMCRDLPRLHPCHAPDDRGGAAARGLGNAHGRWLRRVHLGLVPGARLCRRRGLGPPGRGLRVSLSGAAGVAGAVPVASPDAAGGSPHDPGQKLCRRRRRGLLLVPVAGPLRLRSVSGRRHAGRPAAGAGSRISLAESPRHDRVLLLVAGFADQATARMDHPSAVGPPRLIPRLATGCAPRPRSRAGSEPPDVSDDDPGKAARSRFDFVNGFSSRVAGNSAHRCSEVLGCYHASPSGRRQS
ncbi:MAG: enoyl-CoA hydratase/isomerase family protein [bacterium]|nr:enoyl-CoA hydratase/isomerase family protein [bacterium]